MSFRIRFTGRRDPLVLHERLRLADAAAACELLVEHPCGGRGHCSRCRVRFLEGAPPPTPADHAQLSAEKLDRGWRLACQVVLGAAAKVELPEAVLATPKLFGPRELPAPRREPLVVLTDGPEGLRVAVDTELQKPIATLPATARALGIAFDVGTTTLAAGLVDLESGRLLDTASLLNPQVSSGPEVISRIERAARSPEDHRRLLNQLRGGLVRLLEQLSSRRDPGDVILAAMLSGNATMSHFLADADVRSLGEAPFTGAFTEARLLSAGDLGLALPAHTPIRLLPQIASHVGGDTVAAILATGLDHASEPEALIDLGTNTEIAVTDRHRLLVASAAAGPAFEGAGISCGLRAAPGAIDRVSLSPDARLLIHVLGGEPPRGVCGTGLADSAAVLLEAGALAPSGLLLHVDEISEGVPDDLRHRLVGGPAASRRFVLVPATDDQSEISVSARDLRELQLVKGSIAAGLEILLGVLGISATELRAIYVGGLFGSYLRKESLLRLGLLPPIDPERIHSVADAAAWGTRLALCGRPAWRRCQEIADRAEHVELATQPGYADAFAAALAFP